MTNNFSGTWKCILRVLPYVDRVIIVTGELTKEEIGKLKNINSEKIFIFWHDWEDNFSKQRNNYLNRLREFGQPYGWALVSDHDELLSDEACEMLRKAVDDSAEGLDYSVVKINSHDITYNWLGEKVQDKASDWHKDLLFKVWPTTRYVGNPHEGLKTVVTGVMQFPKEAPYYHIKTFHHIIRRGVENYWVGGGGVNMMESNPTWVEMVAICKKLGLTKFNDFEEYLIAGNVDDELKEWIIKYRDINERPWADSELRSFFIYYFYYLHPNERPEGMTTEYSHYVPMEKDTGIVSRFEKEGEVSMLDIKSKRIDNDEG